MRILMSFIALIMLSSCGTVGRFIEDDEVSLVNRNVYPATKIDLKGISAYAGGIFGGFVTIQKPFYLLDIPISFIVDTIMLPYDIGMYIYNSHYLDYWEDISLSMKIEYPMTEYLEHYDKTGSVAMLSIIPHHNDEELLKLYFDVASANGNWLKTSSESIRHIVLSAEHDEKYNSLRNYTCNIIASNLKNKKFMDAINIIVDGEGYSASCIDKLANHGLACKFIVRNNHVTEKHIRKCYDESPDKFINYLSKRSSTPIDIQKSMYNNSVMKISSEYPSFNKIRDNNDSLNVLRNIASTTKDSGLIKMLFALDNKSIKSYLLYNPYVPVKEKLTDDGFRRYESTKRKFSTKSELLEIIKEYSRDKHLMLKIANSDRLDTDVYEAIMKYIPTSIRVDIYSTIISNYTAIKEGVLFKLILMPDIKKTLTAEDYNKLLVYTEIPVINIINYGTLEFIVGHPEEYLKTALDDPIEHKLPGHWIVKKDNSTNIKMKKGIKFGVFFEVTRSLSDFQEGLSTGITVPVGSPKSLINKSKQGFNDDDGFNINTGYVVYQSLSLDSEMIAGDWTFKAIYNGDILAQITFHLYE